MRTSRSHRAGGGIHGFCTEDRSAKGPWVLALRQLCTPVSMALRPTETGGERRSIELRREWIALRKVATAERRPIGSTDENARGAAGTIRSARVPVLPGCEILEATRVMTEACS